MNREQILLKHVEKRGFGIEIGPSHNPVAPKKDGFKVDVIDIADRDGLISKYKGHDVDLDNIEEVDFVWQGESYAELTGKTKHYDWILASHLIEHTPDIIEFLLDCDTILADTGVVSLAVPDKRFCFDYFRPITSLSRVIDTHFQQPQIHTAGSVAEFFLNVVKNDRNIAWGSGYTSNFELLYSIDDTVSALKTVSEEQKHLDVHAWVFTPHSFRLLIHDLYSLGIIAFREIDFQPTLGCEFFMTLGRSGRGLTMDRLEILKRIDAELRGSFFRLAVSKILATDLVTRLVARLRKVKRHLLPPPKDTA